MMQKYVPENENLTHYLFFTGKGGVGKTTTASATAVQLADDGNQVMLVSTDPASNLQDVFETELTNKPKSIKNVSGYMSPLSIQWLQLMNIEKVSLTLP